MVPSRASPTSVVLPRWEDDVVVRSILVVDDDTAVRGLIVRILKSRGHEVIGEVGSVVKALEQAEVLRPDVALGPGPGTDLTQGRGHSDVILRTEDGDGADLHNSPSPCFSQQRQTRTWASRGAGLRGRRSARRDCRRGWRGCFRSASRFWPGGR